MKVYSHVIGYTQQLRNALPPGVHLQRCNPIKGARVRRYGYDVQLTGSSTRHRNSGRYGAATWEDSPPATWDEHGEWFANLYEIDPDARIANYNNRTDFHAATRHKYPKAAV